MQCVEHTHTVVAQGLFQTSRLYNLFFDPFDQTYSSFPQTPQRPTFPRTLVIPFRRSAGSLPRRPPVSWGSDCFFAAVVTARSPRARAQHLTRKSYYLIIYWPGLWNAPGWNPVIITGSRLLINILFFPRIQSIPLSRANFYVSCCWAHLVGALCSQARDRGLALVLRPVATHCTRGSSRPWPKCQLCPVMTITWESWRDRSRTALSPLGKEVYLPTGAPSAPFLLLPAFLICL